jgi:HEAT repeat protein
MSKLSAHGVKLVLPAVLTAFDDPAWRTKQASIQMLGAMSHLAPKQLATALPKVVPKLIEAFSDTHTKVKGSAQEALNEISEVIRNPEISSISSVLLKALTDPADYTIKALEALIETEFLHAIDAPSLALIVPILHRGLRDRGATTKRFGGLIAGNICTMINDPKDFVPYLPMLLPDLQTALLDPIPDVRSTSAKALGSLTRSLGDHLLELRPWLIKKLRDETCSSAERSGAAQGLTEVLVASGTSNLDETMRSEILPLSSYPEAATREGVLWMLTFLPPAMGQGFASLIDVSLPPIISGLSDDSEPVRDVAMRAGRVLIRSHGRVHVDKILPSLEAGLGDDDHRIRLASLSLLGDLLGMIGGTQLIKGDGDTQDDIRKAERAQAQIALVLGSETRKRVLSGLYLVRSDNVHAVRQSAIQVWKTVVSVTARTLRDIMPVLVSKIIDNLGSGDEEKTEVAGRCLGDLVSKLGDSVLPQVIPVLRNSLADGDENTKLGVCVGLTDVLDCCTKDQVFRYIEIIVKVVQDALCDDDENVRKMAAGCFQSLHAVVGSRAMDEIVPSLMVALESGEKDEAARTRALNGLTGILSVRSRELLPYVVPRLLERPMTANHARVLAGVAEVTGSTIHLHFSSIIPVLIAVLSEVEDGNEREEAIRNCAISICASVDEIGVNWLVSEIASKCGSDKAPVRRESCTMFECFITQRKYFFEERAPRALRVLTLG